MTTIEFIEIYEQKIQYLKLGIGLIQLQLTTKKSNEIELKFKLEREEKALRIYRIKLMRYYKSMLQ